MDSLIPILKLVFPPEKTENLTSQVFTNGIFYINCDKSKLQSPRNFNLQLFKSRKCMLILCKGIIYVKQILFSKTTLQNVILLSEFNMFLTSLWNIILSCENLMKQNQKLFHIAYSFFGTLKPCWLVLEIFNEIEYLIKSMSNILFSDAGWLYW